MDVKNYLIVGAGLSGSVLARGLAEAGHHVDIIDKRDHVAGNAYDFVNEHGIKIHKYGPHIFHTNNDDVVDYLSRFTEWIPYEHKVKALWNDKLVCFPVNAATESVLHAHRVKTGETVDTLETFYGRYTRKMWGIEKEDLDPSILARVPMRKNNEARYFPKDKFQFLPKDGYTRMVENILDHDNIDVFLQKEFIRNLEYSYDHVFNSMPIDEYYGFRFGELPYRSIKFHSHDLPVPRVHGHPVVNFTTDGPYTRMTEWKMFPGHGENSDYTSITVEEPCDYRENNMERYYPVKDKDGVNRENWEKYRAIPNEKVTFIGRTGQYVYLDMHQAVNISMKRAQKVIQNV